MFYFIASPFLEKPFNVALCNRFEGHIQKIVFKKTNYAYTLDFLICHLDYYVQFGIPWLKTKSKETRTTKELSKKLELFFAKLKDTD